MAEDFAVNQGKFSQASISCNDPIEGSCTIILHRRSMRLLQNPDGWQENLTKSGGKRAAKTHSTAVNTGSYFVATRRPPLAGSIPLRGRQAELDESQTPRLEPRRAHLFTGHRSSSLAERVRESPIKRRGSSPWGLAPFWLLFVRTKSNKVALVPPGQSFGFAE